MGNTNTPYIGKNAAPLVNPTVATLFTTALSPIATVASTQTLKPIYARYAMYAQSGPVIAGQVTGAGTSNNINFVRLAVRAGGRVTSSVSSTFTPAIVVFPPSNNIAPQLTSVPVQICAGNPATYPTASGLWLLEAQLICDPVSGLITGTYSGNATASGSAPVITAPAAVTPATGYTQAAPLTALPTTAAAAAAAVTNNGGELALFFGATGIFGTSGAGNIVTLDMFEVEEI